MSQQNVYSNDMFDTSLTQEHDWAPNTTFVHTPENDSTYGRTYKDPDTGKTYRVTETDSFDHPTKLEETYL